MKTVACSLMLAILLAGCPRSSPNHGPMFNWPDPPPKERYSEWRLPDVGIRYATRGDFDAGHPPLVLLHGSLDSMETWLPVLEHLPPKIPAVLIELPGFGESDAPKAGLPQDYLEAVAHVIHELELRPVILVGHALGGLVAAHLTEKYPGNVRHLVVIGAGSLVPPAEHRKTLLGHIEAALVAAAKAKLPGGPGDPLHDEVEWLLRDSAAKDAVVDEALVQAFQERLVSCWSSATKIRDPSWATPRPPTSVPFTAIWGWHDRWVPVDQAWSIRRSHWSTARLFLLTDSGHLPQYEQPAELARILAAHVDIDLLDGLPACLGAAKVRPEDHPSGEGMTRKAFDGTFPATCLP